VEDHRIDRSKRSRTPSRTLLGLAMLVVVLAGISGCTCTAPNCADFAITAPKDGATLPPGDVKAAWTAINGSFCTFGASMYEVSLDGGPAVKVPQGADLSTVFKNVRAGDHVIKAVALDTRGAILGTAQSRFKGEAPVVVPVPAPTPVPTPAPTPVPVPTPALVAFEDTFFDYDKAEIREDQKDGLAKNASLLKGRAGSTVTVEGHCDERGTREYNLALGERRAAAVRDYLISLGVDAASIKTISYGKERPFVEGHDESAWSKNRRGHFVPTPK